MVAAVETEVGGSAESSPQMIFTGLAFVPANAGELQVEVVARRYYLALQLGVSGNIANYAIARLDFQEQARGLTPIELLE